MNIRIPKLFVYGLLLTMCISVFARYSVIGSGTVVNRTQKISGVKKLVVMGAGILHIEQTQGEEELTIEADHNVMPRIQSEQKKDTSKDPSSGDILTIGPKREIVIKQNHVIKYYVKVRDITKIQSSGSIKIVSEEINTPSLTISLSGSSAAQINVKGDALSAMMTGNSSMTMKGNVVVARLSLNGSSFIQGKLTADHLTVSNVGNSNLILKGSVVDQNFTISGSSKINGKSLMGKKGNVFISGAGIAEVNVIEELNANVSGSGVIKYHGDPSVRKVVNGSGVVKKVN